MQSRSALIGTTLVAGVLILAFPRVSLSPGPMTIGHEEIGNDCLACHTPLRGLPTEKCTRCHALDSIAIAGRGARPPNRADTALAGMHQSFAETDCLECHTDHAGPDPPNATLEFSHQTLSRRFRQHCTTCHDGNRPVDDLHPELGDDCAACHTTTEWKPATFEHDQFAGSQTCLDCHQRGRPADERHDQGGDECKDCHTTTEWKPATVNHEKFATSHTCTDCHLRARPADELHRQVRDACKDCHTTTEWKPATVDHQKLTRQACTACHDRKRPTDDLHRQAGNDCSACHTTTAWTPATFEHDQYFVLDRDHQATCRTCHADTGNYRSYTCYGCHEHSEARILRKHREERISNIGDCVRCHRSASEHEGGREGRREGGRRESHEDDD